MRFWVIHVLLIWFAMPPLQACEISTNMDNSHSNYHNSNEHETHCSPKADDGCSDLHPGQSCPPDTDDCGRCHCPGCGVASASFAAFFRSDFVPVLIFNWNFDRKTANFCYQSSVTPPYLSSLFRPPINSLG